MTSTLISPAKLKNKLSCEKCILVDVRSKDESNASRIQNSICVPLDELEEYSKSLSREADVVVYCRTGNRSAKAAEILVKVGHGNIYNLEGGILEWQKQGFDVLKLTQSGISIQRQVLLVMGLFVFVSTILAVFVSDSFLYFTVFVGLGMIFAGITGFCGLAVLLEKMPWNKTVAKCSLN
jgi:rhodanese-related sulfurtransferase